MSWEHLAAFGLLISFVAVAGGVWALIAQKVVVNESGEPTAIEVPVFGKMQTNYPSLVAVFLGVALAVYVTNQVTVTERMIPLLTDLSIERASAGTHLFVGAIPSEYITAGTVSGQNPNKFSLNVEENGQYSVVAFMVSEIRDNRPVYSLVQGPAVLDLKSRSMTYSGTLLGGS
jgi:hypothetical protein